MWPSRHSCHEARRQTNNNHITLWRRPPRPVRHYSSFNAHIHSLSDIDHPFHYPFGEHFRRASIPNIAMEPQFLDTGESQFLRLPRDSIGHAFNRESAPPNATRFLDKHKNVKCHYGLENDEIKKYETCIRWNNGPVWIPNALILIQDSDRMSSEPAVRRVLVDMAKLFINQKWPKPFRKRVRKMIQEAHDGNTSLWDVLSIMCDKMANSEETYTPNYGEMQVLRCLLFSQFPEFVTATFKENGLFWMLCPDADFNELGTKVQRPTGGGIWLDTFGDSAKPAPWNTIITEAVKRPRPIYIEKKKPSGSYTLYQHTAPGLEFVVPLDNNVCDERNNCLDAEIWDENELDTFSPTRLLSRMNGKDGWMTNFLPLSVEFDRKLQLWQHFAGKDEVLELKEACQREIKEVKESAREEKAQLKSKHAMEISSLTKHAMKISSLTSQRNEFEDKNKQLEQDVKEKGLKIGALERQMGILKGAKMDLERSKEALKGSKKALERSNEDLKNKARTLRGEIKNLEKGNKTLKDNMATLQTQLANQTEASDTKIKGL